MAGTWNTWGEAGTQIAGFMFIISMFKQFVPHFISDYFRTLNFRIVSYFRREITITFSQYSNSGHGRSKVYKTIETYLGSKSTLHAKRLKADAANKGNLALTMDDSEEIVDVFQGVVLRWLLLRTENKSKSISWYPSDTVRRAYILTFQAKYRELVTNTYLEHVLEVGRSIQAKQRQRKLYTNNPSKNWEDSDDMWSSIEFKHPATFQTLGIDSKLKEEIMFDLTAFSNGKNHYERIGKAWKRGYLLYGPPGTGKSTMIAAIANYMDYDIYDIELTTVKDNSDLRKLLINIGSKSLIVIEDIDCSLNLTGERKKKDKNEGSSSSDNPILKKAKEDGEGDGQSKVTLSGLLNFIDGLWSSCGGERIIVFTTNHVDKLDPALIRRGRMDKHIELSYCSFEAFKILAKNYLDIESHPLFESIRELLEGNKMTPADVVENLTPRSFDEDVTSILECLVQALEKLKEGASSKGAAKTGTDQGKSSKEAAKNKTDKEDQKREN